MAKQSKSSKIRAFLKLHPTDTPAEVAARLKVNPQYVYVIRSLMRKEAKKAGVNIDSAHAGTTTIATVTSNQSLKDRLEAVPDMVNHPPHYTTGGIETIDFIEAKQLDYHLGNVVKYVARAGRKIDAMEDLKKAQWYLNRAIVKRSN